MKTLTEKAVFLEKTYRTTPADRLEIIFTINSIIRNCNLVPTISNYELTLIIDEAVTNAMEHGNKWDSMKNIIVIMWLEGRIFLNLSIEDEGDGFDFENFKSEANENKPRSRNRGRGLMILLHYCKPAWSKSGRKIKLEIALENKQKAVAEDLDQNKPC